MRNRYDLDLRIGGDSVAVTLSGPVGTAVETQLPQYPDAPGSFRRIEVFPSGDGLIYIKLVPQTGDAVADPADSLPLQNNVPRQISVSGYEFISAIQIGGSAGGITITPLGD